MATRDAHGFSIVELTLVVAVVVGLAAVVVPIVGTAKRGGQVSDLTELVETLRSACSRYYGDTGQTAYEYSSSATPSSHRLALEQDVLGWEGPYVRQTLTAGDNPFGGHIYVYNDLESAYQGGFRLQSEKSPLVTGPGNFVRVTNVPQDVAKDLDEIIDRAIEGNWRRSGQVTYAGSNLYVYLIQVEQ